MATIDINNETLEYNNIIYVDSEDGSDSDGDGSEDNPVSTFGKAIDLVTNNNNEAIYLNNTGDYRFDKTDTWADVCDDYISEVDIIGNKTKIIIHDVADNYSGRFDHINFYQLIFEVAEDFPLGDYSNNDDRFTVFFEHNNEMYFKFHNCVFSDPNEVLSEYFLALDYSSSDDPVYIKDYSNFNNCIFPDGNYITPLNFHVSDQRDVTIKNSASIYSNWTDEGYIIEETSLLDSTFDSDYNITSDSWENEGTGENPDGENANIGVYGGEYAWGEWTQKAEYTIIKQDRDTFDIKKRFHYDKSYDFIDDVFLDTSNGITLSSDQTEGEVILQIPTEGKYKITDIEPVTSNETDEMGSHSDSMTLDREL